MRRTGIPDIGDAPWGTHFCQFYRDKQDLIDVLVPYFKAGLESNEFCMWVTSEPLGVDEAAGALAREVENLGDRIRRRQIEILDFSQWYTLGGKLDADRVSQGWVEKLEAAEKRGFEGLRLTGNTFWLEKTDWQRFREYEALVGGVIGQYRMLAMCTYSLAKCGAAEIMDVVSNHAFALIKRGARWQIIESAERKRMEVALRETEETRLRLAAIVESSTDAIVGQGLDGAVLSWNIGAERLYGYSGEEALGRHISFIAPPELAGETDSLMECVKREDLIQDYETIRVRKDGRRVDVALTLSPIRNRAGEIIGASSIARDIGGRKKAEGERKHLASFPEMNPNPVIEVDARGNIVYANPAAPDILKTLGMERDARVFLPPDIGEIISAGEHTVQREVAIGDRTFAEDIYVAKHLGVARIYTKDVTERKRAEEALREQREWLRVTLNSIGDAVLTTDTKGRVTFLNPVAAELTGWTAPEALGQPVADVFRTVNEQTDAPPADIVDRALREGRAVSLANHTALVTRDGRNIPIEDSAAPIQDGAGQVAGVVLVFHDVSEKRQAQEALRRSEQQVRMKLNSILSPEGDIGRLELGDIIDAPAIQRLLDDFYRLARIPMAIIDLKGKVLVGVGWQQICTEFHRVHPETCRYCIESDTELSAGVAPGEFRLYKCKNNMWDVATPIIIGGKHVGNLFSGQFFFADEDLDYSMFRSQAQRYGFDEEAYLAALEKAPRLSREAVDAGMAFLTKLGHALSLLSYSNIKLARSLTEREALMASLKESGERLSRAQEIAHVGSWELDLANNRLFWSDEVYRMFGLQPQAFSATYEAFLDSVHPEDRAAVDAAYSDSLRLGKASYEISHRIVRKGTGEVRWVHEKCEHIRDGSGRIIRSEGMVQDITEQKRAEERLLHAQKLESIGLLAGGIAHDFNNLLVGVIGNASLAEDMLPRESPAIEILRRIIQSGEQAAHLTRQMLAYAGKGRFIVELVDLSEVVRDASRLIQSSVSKKIAFQFHLEPGIPMIETDRGQIQQVIMNLALNAAEAIGGDSGVITVATGERTVDSACTGDQVEGWAVETGRYVLLEVRDTGCGMDASTKARIFDPFFTTKFQGRGLGLAAVAGIVRAHKGAIDVETAPGAGATFRVLFPAAASAATADAPASESASDLRGRGAVLVVDDEQVVRDLARRSLERQGYEVLLADSGPAAIDIVRSYGKRIQLVILDLGMPGMSGEEALPHLRKLRPDLEVIVSSGYSEAETMRMFQGARVSGYIQKPYTVQQLAGKVKAALA